MATAISALRRPGGDAPAATAPASPSPAPASFVPVPLVHGPAAAVDAPSSSDPPRRRDAAAAAGPRPGRRLARPARAAAPEEAEPRSWSIASRPRSPIISTAAADHQPPNALDIAAGMTAEQLVVGVAKKMTMDGDLGAWLVLSRSLAENARSVWSFL
ncbi:predicted GPI-anchored protein 58 [Setaria italica]|uniref:predicted GPI-anchored protein 58 n=1 Tax=Setaria italica TaxID=4555 RepID=UPI000350A13B|nr:predicted GPI-anchored protein 58 [Setaria italica]